MPSRCLACFFFVFVGLMASSLRAEPSMETCSYRQNISGNPFRLRGVEMVARDHRFGLFQAEDVALDPWIDVGAHSILGLDAKGRVLQVLTLPDRTIAYLLSGTQRMQDLFLSEEGLLFAVDHRGEIHQFAWPSWSRSQNKRILNRAVQRWGVSVCAAGVGSTVLAYLQMQGYALPPELVPALFGVTTVATGLLEFFLATYRFERDNEVTDGFKPIGIRLTPYRQSEPVRSCDGQIFDYHLQGATTSSLQAALQAKKATTNWRERGEFQLQDKHFQLPRGIAPQKFGPE